MTQNRGASRGRAVELRRVAPARWDPALASRPAVCDVYALMPAGDTSPPRVLVDIPHGATRFAQYDEARRLLRGPLPPRLERFYAEHTDVGAPACGRWLAEALARRGTGVLVVRGLLPRVFCDCNRDLTASPEALARMRLSPAIPPYVTDAGDRERLRAMHVAYDDVSRRAHQLVCGAGGLALSLHTYVPRSLGIFEVDPDIVERLERAYRPGVWEQRPLRPEVDVISRDVRGALMGNGALAAAVHRRYAAAGIEAESDAVFSYCPGTCAYHRAEEHAGQVLCLELRRDLLVERFDPFEETWPSAPRVARMTAPLADAFWDVVRPARGG